MRYKVVHTTRYTYRSPVELAVHMVHLRPRPLDGQRIISERLECVPSPERSREGHDHFGNRVSWLFMDLPHAEFVVSAHSVVDVGFAPPPLPEETPAWELVAQAARAPSGWHASEFRFDSPMAAAHADAKAFAIRSFTPGRPILSALLDLNGRFRAEFRFRSGVTSISTPITQVLQRREGVCQDFSHVMVSALRSLGLPARYVSGYIRTKPPPGQTRRIGSDQSHAWVGCWMGPSLGWVDLDPTNDLVVKDEHVVLGWGRDFGDVSPVQGIILGGGRHTLAVTVDLEPDGDAE